MDNQIDIFADLDLPIQGLLLLLPRQPLLQRLLNGPLIRQFLVRLANGNELANAIVDLILLKLTDGKPALLYCHSYHLQRSANTRSDSNHPRPRKLPHAHHVRNSPRMGTMACSFHVSRVPSGCTLVV